MKRSGNYLKHYVFSWRFLIFNVILTLSWFSNFSVISVSAASITLSVPTNALNLSVQPNNTFTKSSSGRISVKTDAFAGYTLFIRAENSNELINGNNSLASITNNLTEEQYKASGNTNTWGYQPNKFNNSNNSSFLPGPTTENSIIEKTSVKNDTVNSYDIVLGAKIDSSIPNGIYTNTFIFTATVNTVTYNITYNLNEGNWTDKSPQSGSTTNNTITLSDAIPTRSGYDFLGWCSVSTSTDECTGTTYQPGNSINLSNSTNNIQLWARWLKQKSEPEECRDLTQVGQTGVLTDSRDSNTYKIARLADGKCWMTQNLRLVGRKQLTPDDSDVTKNFTLPASSGSSNCHNDEFSSTWNAVIYENPNPEYGVFYNYLAATAGTGTTQLTHADAPSSVCPKGWRLPNSDDLVELLNQYPGESLFDPPMNIVRAGYAYSGESTTYCTEGSGVRIWSSTAGSDSERAYFLLYNKEFNVNHSIARTHGFSIRCIARD